MAKKKHRNYRAEQARRKNEEDRIWREKEKARKAFWDKNGKQIMIAAAIVIVALIVIRLVYSFFYGPGGSLPVSGGKLRTAQPNWIVTDLSTTSTDKYFKLGEMEAPEGYTFNPEMSGTGDLAQTFYYNADDEAAIAQSIYVSGVANSSAEAYLERLLNLGMFMETEGAQTGTVAGQNVHYAYLVFDVSAEKSAEEGTVTYASLVMYTDAAKDSCVLMMLNSAEGAPDTLPTSAEMLAEAEKFMPLLKVEK